MIRSCWHRDETKRPLIDSVLASLQKTGRKSCCSPTKRRSPSKRATPSKQKSNSSSESSASDSTASRSSSHSDTSENDSDVYEIDAILQERTKGSVTQYLVRWKGYSSSEDSWVEVSDMNAPDLMHDFLQRKKRC